MKKYFSILVVSLPAISFALQGGPVQPDYVQFEPSGMQDMVNLLTGDFSYQVPLGDLPSPYGNYPLSVSYQAGISPQQEASWVGLGWSLNPGVINRNLRGVPDDQFHGGTLGFIYQYSVMQMWNVDVSVGVGPFGLGMSCSSDGTVGYSVTLGAQVGAAQVGFTMSTDGTVGLGVSTSAGPAKASAGVSYSIKDRTPSASAGAQLFPASVAEVGLEFGATHVLPMAHLPSGEFPRRIAEVEYMFHVWRNINAGLSLIQAFIQEVDSGNEIGICGKIGIQSPYVISPHCSANLVALAIDFSAAT